MKTSAMYFSTSLSPAQLLDLWSDLNSCYYNDGPHSDDSCEIYFFRLLPSSPFAEKGEGPLAQKEREAREHQAARELANLLAYFCAYRECHVSVAGGEPTDDEREILHQLYGLAIRAEIRICRKGDEE